jgi:hypothetical protein
MRFAVTATCALALILTSDCAAATENIAAEIYDNLVFIQIRVNGAAPHPFILDTGANTSFVNESLARSLDLGAKKSVDLKIGTGESSAKVSFEKHVTLSLGSIVLPPGTVAITSLTALESRLGREIGGIIGADIFKRYVVTIDYAAGSVSLDEPKGFSYRGSGVTLPLRIKGDRPFLSARVTPVGAAPVTAFLVIDSGDTSALEFHTPYVAKHNLRAANQPLLPHLSKGLAGDSRNWRGRAAGLDLGSITIDRPLATFAEATKGSEAESDYDGQIGGEILRRFTVVLDYSSGQMILQPNARFGEPFESDMSGLTLNRAAPEFQDVTIEFVDAGSIAERGGVRAGDVIETIDSSSAASLSLDAIRRMFRQDRASHVLRIRRGAESIDIKLQLSRRI